METLIIHTETEKINAIATLLKAFDISFEIKKSKEKSYDPEFVEKILERSKSAKEGNTTRINPNDLWGSLGL